MDAKYIITTYITENPDQEKLMPRSKHIYLVRTPYLEILGLFTVKHECLTFIEGLHPTPIELWRHWDKERFPAALMFRGLSSSAKVTLK